RRFEASGRTWPVASKSRRATGPSGAGSSRRGHGRSGGESDGHRGAIPRLGAGARPGDFDGSPRRTPTGEETTMTPQEMVSVWERHLDGEFGTKDVEAALATMAEDAVVDHMPHHTGGRGKGQLRPFYREEYIPSWPDDLKMTRINRVVAEGQLV